MVLPLRKNVSDYQFSVSKTDGVVGLLAVGINAGNEHYFLGIRAFAYRLIDGFDLIGRRNAGAIDRHDYEIVFHA